VGEGSGEGSGAVVGSGEGSTLGSGEGAGSGLGSVEGLGSGAGLGSGLGESVAVVSVVGSAGGSSANAVGPVRVIRTARTTEVAIGLRIRFERLRYLRPNDHASPTCELDLDAEFLRNIHPSSQIVDLVSAGSEEPHPAHPPGTHHSGNCCRQLREGAA
jgi:hypothetical protein